MFEYKIFHMVPVSMCLNLFTNSTINEENKKLQKCTLQRKKKQLRDKWQFISPKKQLGESRYFFRVS